MRKALAFFIFLVVVFSLSAYDFNGEWYAKFELNEKYEKGVVFKDVEIDGDIIYVGGIKREFKVLDDFYIMYDGRKYSYGTNDNMIVLYSLGDYQFDRILFLKTLRE